MDNRPIGVFDSGLGGLTTVKKLRERMPSEHIIYFGDTGRVPYGTKGVEIIRRYAAQDCAFLLSQGVKLVVAACGTASSCVTDGMAARLPVPFLRVIDPAARAAVRVSRSGRIGVIGTAATIRSDSYARAIRALRPDAQVFSQACPIFVPLVEFGYAHHPAAHIFAEEYLSNLLPHDIDTLVLGCTHYPLLADTIADIARCPLIDTGEQAALAAEELLREKGLCAEQKQGGVDFYVSDLTDAFEAEASRFLGAPVEGRAGQVDIESVPPVQWSV